MPHRGLEHRIGAIAAIAGSVLLFVGTWLHPIEADPNDSVAAFTEYAADHLWIASHLIQFAGMVLMVAALLILAKRLEDGDGAVWARLGSAGAIAGLALAAALQAVDGVALKVMVDAWAVAQPDQKAAAFQSAFAVRQVEVGLASMLSLLLGVTMSAYGVALLGRGPYPKWLGAAAVVGGVPTAAAGIAIAYTGFSGLAMAIGMPANAVLLIWMLVLGVIMWRVPDGVTTDQHDQPTLISTTCHARFAMMASVRRYPGGGSCDALDDRSWEDAMVDPIRRKILKTGAAATVMAAAPRAFAHVAQQGDAGSFYERGPVRIHYEEIGAGFPLLLIAGGGLNSTIAGLRRGNPFNPIDEFKGEYRCVAADLRNAYDGRSTGPLEIDRPWDAYTDDQLGLMDHLRIDKFMVLGFCIGGPFIWNLLERAPDRIVAAVIAQPSGSRPEMRDLFYDTNMKGWGPELIKRRPDITTQTVDRFLTRMYRTNADFVFTVTRDFVRACQTPMLILPDDIPSHPYAVAMEAAMLAPKAEVSMFPWKEPRERIPLAVRQIRSFLRAHRPASS